MFENILIGVDGRQGGRDAIALARQLEAPDAHLTLVNVYGAGPMPGRGAALLLASECRLSASLLERERASAEVDAELDCCADHAIGRALANRAALLDADLIAVGSSSHHGLGRCAFGDDAAAVLTEARCPVAIAPFGHAESTGRIIRIGVEAAEGAGGAGALALARRLGAELGARVQVVIVNRPPGPEFEARSRRLDLLIAGPSSQGLLERLLHGENAEHLARRCACPLLVLPRASTHERPAGRWWAVAGGPV